MDSKGTFTYSKDYKKRFSDNSIVTKAYVDEQVKNISEYSNYLAKQLDKTISYANYLAEGCNKLLSRINKLEQKPITTETFFNDITFDDY